MSAIRPGLSVVHRTVPTRSRGLVRCDVAAIIGVVVKDRWPDGASAGDFLHLELRRSTDLLDHPRRTLFDRPTQDAVRAYFANGGQVLHVYGVCVEAAEDLTAPDADTGVLADLLHALQVEEDIALLAVPCAAWFPTELREGQVVSAAEPLYDLLLQHCRQMNNRFLVMDAPRGVHGEALEIWLHRFRRRNTATRSYGAIYYPWLQRGRQPLPPSGPMLGVFSRMEREHDPYGVAWPPANTILKGVTHAETELDWVDAGPVTNAGANPLVVQPGKGILVFGARTLSLDPRWRAINSRRVVSMISEQLRRDSLWVVFEQNEPATWAVVERDVKGRLDEFWEGGMLSGPSAGDEYLVRCNDETNPKAERDAGLMHVQVALRPVTTTEHITIELRLGEGGVTTEVP